MTKSFYRLYEDAESWRRFATAMPFHCLLMGMAVANRRHSSMILLKMILP